MPAGSAHPCPPLLLQKPTATPSPQAGSSREAGHRSAGVRLCTQLHSPVSDPARVAMGALAVDVVAGVAILAGGTELLAALSVEARRAGLVAFGAVPARLAGQAAPVRHGARLQALALPAPATAEGEPVTQRRIPKPPPAASRRARGAGSGPMVSGHSPPPAALAVEASRARLAAIFSPVARLARAGPVHLVALALVALAVPVTAGPERPLPALAAARELLAGRVVAGALVVAAAAPPAGLAQAVASLLVTLGVVAAIAGAGALGSPPVGLAGAFARLLVTFAVLAEADVLAFGTPAVGVAGALACHVLALPVGVAAAHLLAVGTPELPGTFCGQSCQPQHCPWDNPTAGHQWRPPVPMGPLDCCPPPPPPSALDLKGDPSKGTTPWGQSRGTGKG